MYILGFKFKPQKPFQNFDLFHIDSQVYTLDPKR
jgi:hypothetical protein